MKTFFTTLLISICTIPMVIGQNDVEVSASDNWVGFMNVFNLNGGYEFGSAWDVPVLKTTLDLVGDAVILQPNFNTYADADPTDEFWINQTTGEGNKTMEALTFVEPGAAFNGSDLTFSGSVMSFTLDSAYSVKFFIKALDPNDGFADALGGAGIFDLPTSGNFSVSIPGDQLAAGLVIQYGFSVTGLNANPADEAALGNVVIGPSIVSVANIASQQIEVSVYPNPTTDFISIESATGVSSFDITNINGQTVMTGSQSTNIDVSTLTSGNYLITVRSDEGQNTLQFSKK